VNLNADKVRAYALSVPQWCRRHNANMDFRPAISRMPDEQFVVRVAGKFSSIEDLRRLVVGRTHLGAIYTWRHREIQEGEGL